MLRSPVSEPQVLKSPGVGVRRVAQLRKSAILWLCIYAALAAVGSAFGGPLVLAGFLGLFAYMGFPIVVHVLRIMDPSTQTSSGILLPGELRVHGDEVTVAGTGDAMIVPRAEITDGWVEPFGPGGHRLVLRHKSSDLGVVEIDSVARGNAVLEAIGFSADRHALRVKQSGNAGQSFREVLVLGATFAMCVPLIVLGVAEGAESIALGALGTVVSACVVALLALWCVKPVVRVGVDGIEITKGRSRRFIPVRAIESVDMSAQGVQLVYEDRNGRTRGEILRCWGVQQAALHARILEVVRGFGSAQASAAQLARLDRQGRDLPTWREALRRVAADDAGDYRRIGLARDDIGRLLGQGDAPAERRIGAAMALAQSGDPAEREKVRIAARACAHEELRAALERIAEDEIDEATLEAALRVEAPRTL
jgi:hypothetical protein